MSTVVPLSNQGRFHQDTQIIRTFSIASLISHWWMTRAVVQVEQGKYSVPISWEQVLHCLVLSSKTQKAQLQTEHSEHTFFWSVTKICVSSCLSPVLCVLLMLIVEGPSFKHAIITFLLQSGPGTLSKATRCAGTCTKKAQVGCSSARRLYQHRQKGEKIFYNLNLRRESDSIQPLETKADWTESWSPLVIPM